MCFQSVPLIFLSSVYSLTPIKDEHICHEQPSGIITHTSILYQFMVVLFFFLLHHPLAGEAKS